MSSNPKDQKGQVIDLAISDKIKETLSAQKKVEEMRVGKWNILQDILQDVQAEDIASRANIDGKKTPIKNLIPMLITRIESDYEDDPDTRDLLKKAIPTYRRILNWTKDKDWDLAVQKKLKTDNLYSAERRARVIDALYRKAVDKGDVRAMDLYCKLSGEIEDSKEHRESKAERTYLDLQKALFTPKNRDDNE
ncbi:MAG: hypothetical protein KDD52_05165 [Bdellovibrionales bacterium]|nr:hypothetical protein [Bdellovibrionales bacterium]